MTHLYTQQLKNIWMILSAEKIQTKIITPQMSVFQEEDSVHGIRIPNSRG